MSARADLRPAAGPQQGPREERPATGAARILDRIAEHQDSKGWLDLNYPDALELCAAATDELHDELHGVASALAGPRPDKYFREQLRGEHPLTLLDLCRLAVTAPRGVARALGVLARGCGYELSPMRARAVDLSEAKAGLAETSGRLLATVERATADGLVDDREDREIDEEIRKIEDRVAELKAAKERGL